MRIVGIVFFAVVLILIGLALVGFSIAFTFPHLEQFAMEYAVSFLKYLQESSSARLIVMLSGILIILISISFAQLILGRFQSEKTIAFTTGSGEVTIALGAIEDLIRRAADIISEIRELRPDVVATKKGLIVNLRVVLRNETNIPELTARLQDLVRTKIQDVIGIEEPIIINPHFAKLISGLEKEKKKKDVDDGLNVPFQNYERV